MATRADRRLDELLDRLDGLLGRVEGVLPSPPPTPNWNGARAYQWQGRGESGILAPIPHPHDIRPEDLYGVDRQKAELERNTHQFVTGRPANNALLWGARGTGKSSLVKAMLPAFGPEGLRIIQVDRDDLVHLPLVVEQVQGRLERFILYCDDLSFEAGDPSFKALKAVLDGSLSEVPENVLIYATSNRRHLLPEYLVENREAKLVDGEIHHGDSVEEKISLSERFGLWLSFYPFSQDVYLEIVFAWLRRLGRGGVDPEQAREAALRWALAKGSRSGRSAWQFARDWVGRKGL